MNNGSLENILKEMILREELAPGERVTEIGLSERLGVSRTPIRTLLPRLASEGFLTPVGKRGFAVARFSDEEIFNALDLRALLEGWAARKLAEQGADPEVLAALDDCLAEGDRLFEKRHLDLEDEHQYGLMNARFHRIIVEACGIPMLAQFIERLNVVPFVAPSVIVFDRIGLRRAFDLLHRAHGCHHAVVEAIRNRDAFRAEFLLRDHANHQRVSMFERRKGSDEGNAAPPARKRGKRPEKRD